MPRALYRLPGLKEPERLPRFLTDEQVRLLRNDFEARVTHAVPPEQHGDFAAKLGEAAEGPAKRDALLDRAAFYLLWQCALRLGEVEELKLEDLDLPGRRLTVRDGKGRRDRTVYLTGTAVRAVREYLRMRGLGATSHVFLYRNQPVCKDLIRRRLHAAGKRVGVKVYPHRLRHTAATQLVNAGCRITTIQKLLGHQRLSSTMIYARVHDVTVATDYCAAMAQIEKRLDLGVGTPPASDDAPLAAAERAELLVLVGRMGAPDLSADARLGLVEEMRRALAVVEPTTKEVPAGPAGSRETETGHAGPRRQPAIRLPRDVSCSRPLGTGASAPHSPAAG